jgi:DNA-binding transcriptional MerR regulator
MNLPSEATLAVLPDRLSGESTRAYRAFRYYCEWGPDRSEDRAWREFCKQQGKKASARRPGSWSAWSVTNHWVKRAEDYDDSVEEERSRQEAERRRSLQQRRHRLEIEEQTSIEARLAKLQEAIENASPREITQVKIEAGKKTTTKVGASRARDFAALVRQADRTAKQAILGVREGKDCVRQGPVPDRVKGQPLPLGTVSEKYMNVTSEATPACPERLPSESTRAYRAFRYYCELGPDRSEDRAWREFCKQHGKKGSARRPGWWSAWSGVNHWVKRAEDYDNLIEEERSRQEAEQRQSLQERRLRLEMAEQTSIEARLDKLQETIENASSREITLVKIEAGKKTTTRVRSTSGSELAALVRQADRTAKQAILGVGEGKDRVPKRLVPDRVRWATVDDMERKKRARLRSQPGGPKVLGLADRPVGGPEDPSGLELKEAA